MEYSNYYCSYLNINTELLRKDEFIFSSTQRNVPICHYYYHYIIVSHYNGNPVISIVPELYDHLRNKDVKKELLFRDDYVIHLLKSLFVNTLGDFNVRKMYRMGINSNIYNQACSSGEVIQLKSSHKDIFFNTISSINDNSIKEYKWNLRKEQITDGRMFAIIKNEKMISYAVISDINFNGGNISVWTSENYTGRGYGKSVTLEAIKWCIQNGIIPIYLVDRDNIASIKIAKSLGFDIFYKEVILSKTIKTRSC